VKIGRNDPCPCGSGKKYKKCCALNEDLPDLSLPEELKTGTRLDDYMELMQAVVLYYQGLTEFDTDRKELNKAVKDFEKRFRPGTDDGVTDGLYMPWLLFDLRFGKSGKTVCERFLEDSMMKKLGDPGLSLIRHMSDSYATFYEVIDSTQERIRLVGLGTGAPWNVHRLPDIDEEVMKGDIWYIRFVGPADDAFEFSMPYMFDPDAKEVFAKAIVMQVEETRKTLGGLIGSEKLFRESCKAALPGWAEYMLEADIDYIDDEMPDDEFLGPSMPVLLNTDGEMMRFCNVIFKVLDEEAVKTALNSMKGFDYDVKNKMWVWFKKGNKQISILPTTSLGTLTIKRGRLTCETNSEERAERLAKKLKKELQGLASFEKMEAKDFDELPPPSEKKRKRIEAEHEELMKNPEVREATRKMAEEYYHKDWLTKPVPALSGQSPLEAVKTPDGRKKVEKLLEGLETMQDINPDEAFRIDIKGLRVHLGI
jgi:hypothetical protein